MKMFFQILLFFTAPLILLSYMSDNIQEKIDKIFEEFNLDTPGAAVAVFRNGKIIYNNGYGLADLDNKIPINNKTNFRLASVTKQFTSMSVLILEQERKLSLNDGLRKFFPLFPDYGKNITIKHLLQHTSGLLDYEDFIDDTSTYQVKDKDVLSILMKQDSTYFTPGAQHRYSNSGFALLALIVEKVSGKSFDDYLMEKIFIPLDMKNSIAFINGLNEVKNRAYGYTKTDSGFVFSDQSSTSAVLGDGGIYTSIEDMFKWNMALNNSTLLSSDKQKEAWTKGIDRDGSEFDYGYGWRLNQIDGNVCQYHTGGTCGFSNVYMRFPNQGLSVIVLINIRDYPALDYGKKVADLFLK